MRLRITLTIGFVLVAAVLAVTVLTACSGSTVNDGRTQVVAAFYPLAYAAEQVGRPHVSVYDLTPAGAEPHDLELSPNDVRRIQQADVVFLLGHGFQPQVERAAKSSSGNVVTLLDTPGLRRIDNDPHIWLDPLRYALLVGRIGAVLHEDGAANRLASRLHRLDRDLSRGLSDCRRHEIVTSHAAFGYLAGRYGLEQISIEGLTPEAEPTPVALRRVAEIVRRKHVTTIYFETLVSPKLAQTLARETGTKTAVLDPIEGLKPNAVKRGADYVSVMQANLESLREGLACR